MQTRILVTTILLASITAGALWVFTDRGSTVNPNRAVVVEGGEFPVNDATSSPEVQKAFGKAKIWEHKGKQVADLRSIKPRVDRGVVPPTKSYKSMLARSRRLAMRYGVALPPDVKLTPEDWTFLMGVFKEANQHCLDLGIERVRTHDHIWDSAEWTKVEDRKQERKLRGQASAANAIFRLKTTKEGTFFASFTRKQSPELWKYEDRADAFWIAYLSEFLLLVAKRNRL